MKELLCASYESMSPAVVYVCRNQTIAVPHGVCCFLTAVSPAIVYILSLSLSSKPFKLEISTSVNSSLYIYGYCMEPLCIASDFVYT